MNSPKPDDSVHSVERFGVITTPIELEIGPHSIRPIASFKKTIDRLENRKNKDGFWYPTEISTWNMGFVDGELVPVEEQPNTTRPPHLFKCWSTHAISCNDDDVFSDDFRSREGAFLIHLLAFLWQARTQFEGYWHDGRLPIDNKPIAVWTDQEAQALVEKIYSNWSSWDLDNQTHYTALLHLFTRAESYDWPWERFVFYYMVADGVWKLNRHLHPKHQSPRNVRHEDRLNCLRDHLLGEHNWHEDESAEIKKIVSLRNNWFHEGAWNRYSSPLTKIAGTSDSADSILATFSLRRLVQRLLLAITGVKCGYLRTRWWGMQCPIALELQQPL